MKAHPNHPGRRGFSLIELVIVLIIAGTLGAIAIPRLGESFAQRRVIHASERVVADLKWAKAQARALGQDVTVTFTPTGNTYTVSTAGQEDRVVELGKLPYGVNLLNTTDFNGTDVVTFNAYGLPDHAGVVKIRIPGTTRRFRVDVTASGEVSHALD